MKKRILSMLLSIVMVVSLLPGFTIAASAATGVYAKGTLGQYDRTAWTIYDDGLLVIDGKGNTMTSVNWDSTTASPWKGYEDVITKVTFVNCQNWTSLPAHSFKGLSNLKEITLPENLEVIQQLALGYTGIETIELPQTLKTIGEAAFSSCKSLNYVNIHNGITTIEARAFWDCDNLKAISIPDSVTLMRQEVFQGCENLEYVRLGSGFSTISSSVFSGCNLLETLTIPSNVTTIGVQFLSKNASLKGVYYQGTVVPTTYAPNGTNGTFYGIDKAVPIYTHTTYEGDTIGIKSQYLNDVRTVTKIDGYFVNMAHSVGGAFKVDKSIVPVGDTVTVDIMAYKNYALDTFAVKDADGNEITVNGDGNTRTFAMPAGDVTISATFKSTIVPHVHSWSFEVEGTRINATCANSDGMCHNPNQSVVMTAPATKYFAWSLERTVTVSGTIEDVEVSDVVYTLKSTGEVARPFAPGVYVATITVGGVAVACEYEITKSDQLNYTFFTYTAPTNLTYDGTAKVATAVLSENVAPYIGDIEVLYNGRKEAPVNKGEYAVTINVAESDYYFAKSSIVLKTGSGRQMKDAKFTIDAKDIADLTYILEDGYSLTDGGVTPDVTIQYNGMTLVKDTDYTIAYANNTAPGTATMTITGIGNYTGTKTLEFNIASHTHNYTYTLGGTDTIKATCSNEDGNCTATEQTVKLVAPSDLVYSGTVKTATVEGTIGSNIPEITYEGDCKSVGTHTASIALGGVTASVEFEITAATPTIAWSNTNESVDYTGSAAVITAPVVTLVNGEAYSGTISYSYTGTSVGNGLPINVGTYEITASIPAQGNYAAAATTNKLTLTITKAAAPAIAWPIASSLVYGQKLSASVLNSNDDNGTFAWEEENTVPTVANNGYVVVYTPGDTDNYDYTGVVLEKTIAITVTAADQADFSISGATTATYGDAPITLTAAGGSGTGTITWEITSGDQFASIDQNGVVTIKGAGTVTVKATKAADGNYKEKVDTHEITISKATVSADNFSYSAPSDLVYSKTEKAATVTGDAAYGAITIKYYSESSLTTVVSPINVGTYYVGITTAGGDNYEAVTTAIGVGSFEITARPVTVTAAAKTMQYGDNVPELTYTHNLIEGDSFTGSLATTATKTSDVGEYDITKGDLANSNYTISFNGAKLTITKANGPAAPTVTGSYTSDDMTYTYTVDAITGAEYSKDGTKWQDSNVFANLVAGQKYTFYARIKETKNVLAGAIGTSAEVDLSKLSGKGTVTISDWTYGKDAATPKIESTTGNAVESYLYESTDGKGYSSANAPTNAGEYKLTVTFAATTTHNGTTASDTFTIKKATPAVTAPSNLTATYGDTLASVQLPEGWAWKDAATTEVGTVDGTNEFTVIYTHPTDADNHEQVEKTVSIAVNPKAVTAIVTVVGENFIFNGSEQKPGVTVKDDDNTIPESEYTVSYKDNTNAGTATVTVTDKEGGNYTVTGETTFAIAKKASSALSGVEREFMRTIATTGNEIDVEAMLPDDHGTVNYMITSSGYTVLENVAVDANGKLVFDTKTSAAAASDTITVKVEMQNYTDVTLTVSVILNDKTPQEITGVSAVSGLIYNGNAQQGYTGTPTSEKYTGAYEITYTGRSNTYNSSVAPTNAGNYTVTFKIPDTDLYYSGNVSINFTIGKAQATVTADDKEAYVGNRMPALTYKVSGLIGNDTISVELSCNANMNRAGETPIIVTATDPNDNYEITTVNGILTVKNYIYIPVVNPTYPPVVNDNANGDVTVSPKRPEQGDTVTIITDPDKGYEVDVILVTDKNGRLVTLVDNGNGTYSFKQPNGKVTIDITFKEIVVVEEIDTVCPGDKTCPMYVFADLDSSAWYHDGVHFCIENGLMNGVGKNEFQPHATTSRAMIVTILWRLAGEPVVNYLMQFDDVANDQWYTEAIRWAASEGIVNGYSAEKFGPNDTITREQLATILYRYEQKQGGGFTGAWMFRMDYVDLADVSDWAYEAMCWMNMNSIVNGLPDKVLDPKGSATRAQSATMLYRYCEVSDKED